VWEESHFPTEAVALADEAKTAADYEYDPRGGMANPRRRHLPPWEMRGDHDCAIPVNESGKRN
jgi:hypothetical protein